MKKRSLSNEEKELWQRVAKTTERLSPPRPFSTQEKPQTFSASKVKSDEKLELAPFEIGSKANSISGSNSLTPSIKDQLSTQPVQMDKKAHTRMKRGKIVPEARIDLHGMTMAQAHPALIGFVQRSYGEGKRLILVITGKGKSKPDFGPIPERKGVLKHNVPQWLQMAPLSGIVMQVSEAHLKHGGSGAYYVYLRRTR